MDQSMTSSLGESEGGISDYPEYVAPPSVSSGGSFLEHLEMVHEIFEAYDNIISLHTFRNLIGAILPTEAVPPSDPE